MAAHNGRIIIVRSDGVYDLTAVKDFMSEMPRGTGPEAVPLQINVVSIIKPPADGKQYVRDYLETKHDVAESMRNRFFFFLSNMINLLVTALRYLGNCLRGAMFDKSGSPSNRKKRQDTTDGIYLTKCSRDALMLLMDVETSDLSDRAQLEPSFEQRASLLTLLISNVLLLELPSSAIGMNLPMESFLKKIFKEIVTRNGGTGTGAIPEYKTKIVVALDDAKGYIGSELINKISYLLPKSQTSGTQTTETTNNYKQKVIESMKKIWNSAHPDDELGLDPLPQLEDYMDVTVEMFPSRQKTEFNMKCQELVELLAETRVIERRGLLLSADNFPNSVETVWKSIAENKALSLYSMNGEELIEVDTLKDIILSPNKVPDPAEIIGTSTAGNNNLNLHFKNESFSWEKVRTFFNRRKGRIVQLPQNMSPSDKIEMISGEGEFKSPDVDRLMDELKYKCRNKKFGAVINVVSIIGPQSSGKSSLLNQLFGTDFKVLDTNKNWGRTTQGIWIGLPNNTGSHSSSADPPMVVIDVEGSDSSNRAEEGTTFENRSALFALVISNVMLLNLKATAFAQHQGSCVPLLETIFQERIKFAKQKTKIVVTLRDCNNWDNNGDREIVKIRMKQTWDSVTCNRRDPVTNKPYTFEDYIEVHVIQFPHFEAHAEEFKTECVKLQKFLKTTYKRTSGGAIIFTADDFSKEVEKIWTKIKGNENLNIPSLKELLYDRRCGKIMDEIRKKILPIENNSHFKMMKNANSPKEFNRILQDKFLPSILHMFDDATAELCEQEVMKRNRDKLESEMIDLVGAVGLKVSMEQRELLLEKNKLEIKSKLEKRIAGFWDSIIWSRGQVLPNVNTYTDTYIEEYMTEFENLHEGLPEVYHTWITTSKQDYREALKEELKAMIIEIQANQARKLNKWDFLVSLSKPLLPIIRFFGKQPPETR